MKWVDVPYPILRMFLWRLTETNCFDCTRQQTSYLRRGRDFRNYQVSDAEAVVTEDHLTHHRKLFVRAKFEDEEGAAADVATEAPTFLTTDFGVAGAEVGEGSPAKTPKSTKSSRSRRSERRNLISSEYGVGPIIQDMMQQVMSMEMEAVAEAREGREGENGEETDSSERSPKSERGGREGKTDRSVKSPKPERGGRDEGAEDSSTKSPKPERGGRDEGAEDSSTKSPKPERGGREGEDGAENEEEEATESPKSEKGTLRRFS